MWHPEVESLLVLKNNRGVEGNRVRHMDYGVQINKLMYTRLLKGGDITLFSPSDVPCLYDAFFADQTNSNVCTPNMKTTTVSASNASKPLSCSH